MLKLVVSLCVLFFSVLSFAGGLPPLEHDSDALKKLSALLAPMKTLQGEFEQSLTDRNDELLQKTEGTFSIKRPGHFLWKTAAPYAQWVVSDQQTLWLYDPDLEQVTVRKMDAQLQQTPAVLLSGDLAELEKLFVVTAESAEHFILQPTSDKQLFERLTLSFEQGVLTEMGLLDRLEQFTRFSLKNIQTNLALDDSLFVFQAPAGTDIITND